MMLAGVPVSADSVAELAAMVRAAGADELRVMNVALRDVPELGAVAALLVPALPVAAPQPLPAV
jgi:hypothetical protein